MNTPATNQPVEEHSYWPIFPKFLPTHFGIVLENARNHGLHSHAVNHFADKLLGMLSGASRKDKDIEIFHDYLIELPAAKALEALHLLEVLGTRKSVEDDLLASSFILNSLSAVVARRPELLLKMSAEAARCACDPLDDAASPTTALARLMQLPANQGYAQSVDLVKEGSPIKMARDGLILFDSQGRASAVVALRDGPICPSVGLDPRKIDRILRYVEGEYPELRRWEQERPHLAPRARAEIKKNNLITLIDDAIARPLSTLNHESRLDVFVRIFPSVDRTVLEQVLRVVDDETSTFEVPSAEDEDDASLAGCISDHEWAALDNSIRTWYRFKYEPFPEWLEVVPAKLGSCREFLHQDPSPLPDWRVEALGINIPLEGVFERCRSIALEARQAMTKPRFALQIDDIRKVPAFFPEEDKIPENVSALFMNLPKLVPTIEALLGVKLDSLPLRTLLQLIRSLPEKDGTEWSRLRNTLDAHREIAHLILEAAFIGVEPAAHQARIFELAEICPPRHLKAILSKYCGLLGAIDELDGNMGPTRPYHERQEWRRAVCAAISASDRCLKRMCERRISISEDLKELEFYRSDLVRLAELFCGPREEYGDQINKLGCEIKPRSLKGLKVAEQQTMKRIVEDGCQDYPEPLRSLNINDFNRNIDSIAETAEGTFHLLVKNREILAFVHVAPNGEGSVYGKYFYARPELQRSGMATEFLGRIIRDFVRNGTHFEAVVWDQHPVWEVYRTKLGFQEFGFTDDIHPGSGLRFKRIRVRSYGAV